MGVGRAIVPLLLLALALTGCFPITITTGGPGTTAESTERTPEEKALLTHLRTTEGPREELAEATDEDLLAVAQSICQIVIDGKSLDDGLRALTGNLVLSDATIVALVGGAQVAYCPDALDTVEWTKQSEFIKERVFLGSVRGNAGSFSDFPDQDAIGYAKSVCAMLGDGSSLQEVSGALHGMRLPGMAPDPDGANAFISAAIVTYCPDLAPVG